MMKKTNVFIDLINTSVADPGFLAGRNGPVSGAWTSDLGAFRQNVCENERIGSHRMFKHVLVIHYKRRSEFGS